MLWSIRASSWLWQVIKGLLLNLHLSMCWERMQEWYWRLIWLKTCQLQHPLREVLICKWMTVWPSHAAFQIRKNLIQQQHFNSLLDKHSISDCTKQKINALQNIKWPTADLFVCSSPSCECSSRVADTFNEVKYFNREQINLNGVISKHLIHVSRVKH